ncbi:MAG: hypothetical protein A2270_04105 [Elusimicrobia bacterium RIFOXYA12_FULL_51_18]|nr:MAG: hypothetical protein A2270_04105 [Elusimicrobia bacterium RIFOXYA12_FULL_51_18]OGS33074.1 MAG: hypothetical protein A2218_04470 [Elusimicrobia bacterium RIFOXYA2_FULL_53_38]
MFAFSLRKFFWGLLVVAMGLAIWAHNYGLIALSFNFSRDWPIIIVIAGLMSIWKAVFGRHWWAKCGRASNDHIPAKARKILEDVENGNMSAEEAIKKMDEK